MRTMAHFHKEWLRDRGSLPGSLGAKLCTQSAQNQDKTKAKEERTEDVSQHASRTSIPLELLEVDASDEGAKQEKANAEILRAGEVPAQGCLNSTTDLKGKGRFSGH